MLLLKPSTECLPSNTNVYASGSISWCVAKLPWKMYCLNAEALSLCIALATVWGIYSTAACLKNVISSGWLPSILFSIWFFLMTNGISVWNSAAASAQKKGALKGRFWHKHWHTCRNIHTRACTLGNTVHTHSRPNTHIYASTRPHINTHRKITSKRFLK